MQTCATVEKMAASKLKPGEAFTDDTIDSFIACEKGCDQAELELVARIPECDPLRRPPATPPMAFP